MKIPIVNEKDEVIEYKEKSELTATDINRDTGLWVLDENNRILLAKRSANKKIYPNQWSVSVAGTVEEGETYESNIIKEAFEEIGLINIKPIFLYKHFKVKVIKRMSSVFKIKVNSSTKFNPEPNEVAELRWFSREEIQNLVDNTSEIFTPNFPDMFKKFIEHANQN